MIQNPELQIAESLFAGGEGAQIVFRSLVVPASFPVSGLFIAETPVRRSGKIKGERRIGFPAHLQGKTGLLQFPVLPGEEYSERTGLLPVFAAVLQQGGKVAGKKQFPAVQRQFDGVQPVRFCPDSLCGGELRAGSEIELLPIHEDRTAAEKCVGEVGGEDKTFGLDAVSVAAELEIQPSLAGTGEVHRFRTAELPVVHTKYALTDLSPFSREGGIGAGLNGSVFPVASPVAETECDLLHADHGSVPGGENPAFAAFRFQESEKKERTEQNSDHKDASGSFFFVSSMGSGCGPFCGCTRFRFSARRAWMSRRARRKRRC